jgi:hypothetical protein
MSNKNTNRNEATNNNAEQNNGAVHAVIENRSPTMIAAQSFIEAVKVMREENAHEDYIKHMYASELQTMIKPECFGDFVAIVNKRTGLHYTVPQLREYDLNTPVLKDIGVASTIEIQRRKTVELDSRIKRGEELSPEQMTELNVSRQAVATYDKAIESGKAPAEAIAEINETMAKEIEQSLIGLEEANKGWLQPKFIAAGTALAAAGFNIVANNKYSVGAVAGGLGGAAVSYFGSDYLFTQIEAVRKLPELVKTGLAASAGTALGLGGVMLGEFLQDRLVSSEIIEGAAETIDTVTPAAIPAPTAEMAAYL